MCRLLDRLRWRRLIAYDSLDKQLGMDRPIARRDFLNGVALAIGSTVTEGFLPASNGRRKLLRKPPRRSPDMIRLR